MPCCKKYNEKQNENDMKNKTKNKMKNKKNYKTKIQKHTKNIKKHTIYLEFYEFENFRT